MSHALVKDSSESFSQASRPVSSDSMVTRTGIGPAAAADAAAGSCRFRKCHQRWSSRWQIKFSVPSWHDRIPLRPSAGQFAKYHGASGLSQETREPGSGGEKSLAKVLPHPGPLLGGEGGTRAALGRCGAVGGAPHLKGATAFRRDVHPFRARPEKTALNFFSPSSGPGLPRLSRRLCGGLLTGRRFRSTGRRWRFGGCEARFRNQLGFVHDVLLNFS